MSITREEYTLSKEDFKFPSFYNKTLAEIFKTQKMSKEILLQEISNLINNIQQIIDLLSNMIKNNLNNFAKICLHYNLNIYDYIIIFQLIQKLINSIDQKLQNKNEISENLTFENFFQNENYVKIIKTQHKITDKNYEEIKLIINQYNNDINDINESNHECGIPFMCYVFKYYGTLIIKAKNKMEEYIKLKYVDKDEDIKTYHKNMILFFDLIYLFRILEKSNLMLHNSYFVDKNDFYNIDEDSEEWKNMSKIMYRVNTKNKDKLAELNFKMQKDFEKMTIYITKGLDLNSSIFYNAMKLTGYAIKFKMIICF